MKFLSLAISIASLAGAASIPSPEPVSYDGAKVYRVKTGKQLASVLEKLSGFTYEPWNHDLDRHIDLVIPAEQVAEFESLDLDTKTLHEDLGASIKAESRGGSLWKRQGTNDTSSWFDSYHPYDDHIQFWKDLHTSFTNQSEWISSGTSYEGRDLFGLHFWGASGPGKPAVLYHAQVHAREWIAAPVRSTK